MVMAMAGLAMGCIDTLSNMQLVKIYQKDSAVFLQVRQIIERADCSLSYFETFGGFVFSLIF